MILRAVLRRMLGMNSAAWEYWIRSLQLSCFLLLAAAVLLLFAEGETATERIRQSAVFQDAAQVTLLTAALVPVLLEDMIGQDRRTPPGSSGH